MSKTPAIIAAAIARRTAAGLKLTFIIPADDIGPEREWSCFPSTHEQRAKWIAEKAKHGWRVSE
ncbi:hypothetical protein GGQ64_005355 [Rhizobium azooxidifex]|uniref:Uncharacterized protein n=1 Tax=Mycoplana azooxidifex TaxID=1636188 RepID=A0A7W6DBD6_9HYPH|nr:hypothetical protein [Mycoplana azooxidifex]MBB3980108.1 hypothetical protein [Mycoplana azooxidifex]